MQHIQFSIFNFQKNNPQLTTHNLQHSSGYSFLELLIVIALVGTIGVVTSQVFIMGLRSQAKSEILKEVKQNGDYASAAMDTMIRNAIDIDNVSCNAPPTQQLSITTKDGALVTYDCSNPQIASRSGDPMVQLMLTSNKVAVSDCNFRVVCPTPPTSPKYVFFNFTISQAGADLAKEQQATLQFQSTISLRNYE